MYPKHPALEKMLKIVCPLPSLNAKFCLLFLLKKKVEALAAWAQKINFMLPLQGAGGGVFANPGRRLSLFRQGLPNTEA